MPRGILNVTDAKTTLSRLITKIQIEADNATPVVIGRLGEPMAVMISVEQFQEYHALATLALAQALSPPPRPSGGGGAKPPGNGGVDRGRGFPGSGRVR
jgi:PHD/YefM family antitoxin component YafN of YafNO toxin-antitoxin module